MEFVAVSMLLAPFAPMQTFIMTLMLQARHLLLRHRHARLVQGDGLKKPYLIFGMCDETFSINYSAEIPPEIDRGWLYFFVTLLNQLYWVGSATLGGLITIRTEGLSFVMTAMFVVIFLDQWGKDKQHASALIGLAASVLCLQLFGADGFDPDHGLHFSGAFAAA